MQFLLQYSFICQQQEERFMGDQQTFSSGSLPAALLAKLRRSGRAARRRRAKATHRNRVQTACSAPAGSLPRVRLQAPSRTWAPHAPTSESGTPPHAGVRWWWAASGAHVTDAREDPLLEANRKEELSQRCFKVSLAHDAKVRFTSCASHLRHGVGHLPRQQISRRSTLNPPRGVQDQKFECASEYV